MRKSKSKNRNSSVWLITHISSYFYDGSNDDGNDYDDDDKDDVLISFEN